jgi:hypothetical protein
MIGMGGQNLLRPIELLAQHGADHEVRPSHRPEGEEVVGARPHGGVMAIGAADEEGDGRRRLLPCGDLLGEIGARQPLAAFIESDNEGPFRDRREEQRALARLACRARQLAPFLDLSNIERRDQPFGIKTLEVEMRSRFEAPDGDDQEAQGTAWLGRQRVRCGRQVFR